MPIGPDVLDFALKEKVYELCDKIDDQLEKYSYNYDGKTIKITVPTGYERKYLKYIKETYKKVGWKEVEYTNESYTAKLKFTK